MPLSIVGKVLHDQWRALAVWTVVSGVFAAFYLSLYPSIGAVDQMQQLLDSMPPALRAMFAAEGVDIGTPAGYLNVELFTFMVPLLVLAVSLPAAAGATAGEEERGTLELLLANPVPTLARCGREVHRHRGRDRNRPRGHLGRLGADGPRRRDRPGP